MAPSSFSERTLLTYPAPRYTRLLIYVSLAILAFGYLRHAPGDWLNPKDQHPGPQGVMPFAWWLVIPITILGLSVFLAIFEGFFVIPRQNPTKLEFDADNFYITDEYGERAIPLKDILSLRLVYGNSIFDAARTSLYRYAIGFGDPSGPEEVTLTVFLRTRRAYSNFVNLVKGRNPSIEVKNWATSVDGLVRLFKGRNS